MQKSESGSGKDKEGGKEPSEKEKAKAKEREEKERKEKKATLERHFALSALEKAPPGFLIHPNRSLLSPVPCRPSPTHALPSRSAKGGKFDCKMMTLSGLLDYRVEDSKEHSFEASTLPFPISSPGSGSA